MANPWLNWWFTGDDEMPTVRVQKGPRTAMSDAEVSKGPRIDPRYRQLDAEEARQLAADNRDGLPALLPGQPVMPDAGPRMPDPGPRLSDSREFLKTFQGDGETPPRPPTGRDADTRHRFPHNINDWSIADHFRIMMEPDGDKILKDARRRAQPASDEREQFGPVLPDGWAPPAQAAPEQTPMQPVQPDTGIPAEPVMNPRQQMIEDIKQQRALLDQIYPQRPTDANPAQAEADAYAEKERERANALAQLAFFSGITQGAGGQWEGVGRGLAGAGQAYSEGFARYQKALQSKATRMSERTDQAYADDAARAGAAIKLYGDNQDRALDIEKESRLRSKEKMDTIDEYFGKRLELAKGNDFTPTDQGAVDRIMKDWRISRDRGEVVDTQDVRDKPDPNAPSS